MYLDSNSLEKWSNNKESIFNKKYILSDRFNKVNEIFKWISENTVSIENSVVKVGNNVIQINNQNPNTDMFGAAKDCMTEDKKLDGILKQIKSFGFESSKEDDPKNVLLMMGGFDFNFPHTVKDEYRILSSSLKSLDFDGSVTSSGQSAWPNSHFSDNTYFFHFMKFAQERFGDDKSESNIALVYPRTNKNKGRISDSDITEKIQNANLKEEEIAQREKLLFRFPFKFLWMWANKDTVLHPFSLMAFRNFVSSKFMEEILEKNNPKLTPKSLTDMTLKEFTQEWKKISNAVLEKLNCIKKDDKYDTDEISKLSKLISILMVEETDMKNASDLLKTSKQIILYGSPGTGKTYTAMNIVKEFIVCNKEDMQDMQSDNQFEVEHRFCKKFPEITSGAGQKNSFEKRLENGLYEIVQFHPNYAYQDFIGGISPNIETGKIGYELKEGIFQKFCKAASSNPDCDFVFIIDEINRANLSEVFGELLYALEYRGRAVNIPYFGEFIIPKNVYIIGTMNDVDKSLVTFDLALRRRFGFFRLDPELDSLSGMFTFDHSSSLIDETALAQYIIRCKALNSNIIDQNRLALESSYQIGQAYFKKIENFLREKEADQIITPFELEKLWIYHIEPLLQEYLGMSLESGEIKTKLETIKKEFIKELN